MTIQENNDPLFEDEIGKELHHYNREHNPWLQENTEEEEKEVPYYNFGVYDSGELVGGLVGYAEYKWYFLEELWVKEDYRHQSVGTKLIQALESKLKEEHLLGIRVETWDFQARGFYEKMGFQVYATFEDCPPGTIDYFLKKRWEEKK